MIFRMESLWRKRKKKIILSCILKFLHSTLFSESCEIIFILILYLIKDVQGVFVLFFKVHNRLTEKTALCQCVVNCFTNPTVKHKLLRWVQWGYWMNEWNKSLDQGSRNSISKGKDTIWVFTKNSNLDQLCIDVLFLYSLDVCMYRVWFDV